jgi:hypothetical protein
MSWWSIEKDLRAKIAELEVENVRLYKRLAEEQAEVRLARKETNDVWSRFGTAIEERDQARTVAGTMLVWAQCSASLMADNPWLVEHPGVQTPGG